MQAPCEDGVPLSSESLTVFRPAVGPFQVAPHTAPANATVRFAVTASAFSSYEALGAGGLGASATRRSSAASR